MLIQSIYGTCLRTHLIYTKYQIYAALSNDSQESCAISLLAQVSNKEAAGVDRIQVDELKSFIDNNRIPVLTSILKRKGMPQGSPLSLQQSNILLDQLYKYLKSKGLKFVRYADDFSVYTKSKAYVGVRGALRQLPLAEPFT